MKGLRISFIVSEGRANHTLTYYGKLLCHDLVFRNVPKLRSKIMNLLLHFCLFSQSKGLSSSLPSAIGKQQWETGFHRVLQDG